MYGSSSVAEYASHPIERPLPCLKKAETAEELKANALRVYRGSVSYHATNKQNKQDIQSNGTALVYEGYRTGSDIGQHLVLRSKRSPAGEDAEGFRQLLSEAGEEIDRARAGELLREVQSDSDEDLPEDFYS